VASTDVTAYTCILHRDVVFQSPFRFTSLNLVDSKPTIAIMNVPKFNEREKVLEDEYIRKREYGYPNAFP
jgi:hypothetical protein